MLTYYTKYHDYSKDKPEDCLTNLLVVYECYKLKHYIEDMFDVLLRLAFIFTP